MITAAMQKSKHFVDGLRCLLMGTVIVTGIVALVAVIIGALASTGSQLFIESKREQRQVARARRLVTGELLQAQLIFRSVYRTGIWPPIENASSYLPTSAWQEHRAGLATELDEDLWN